MKNQNPPRLKYFSSNFPYSPKKKKLPGCLIFLLIMALLGGITYLFLTLDIPDQEFSDTEVNSVIYGDLSRSQKTTLTHLAEQSGRIPEIYERSGVIRSLSINSDFGFLDDPEQQAQAFMAQNQSLYEISDFPKEFLLISKNVDTEGKVILRYRQFINNIPVYGSDLLIVFGNDGRIQLVKGAYITAGRKEYRPDATLDGKELVESVLDQGYLFEQKPIFEQVLFNKSVLGGSDTQTQLAWVTKAYSDEGYYQLVVSASNGTILHSSALIMTSDLKYKVFDLDNINLKKLSKMNCEDIKNGIGIDLVFDRNGDVKDYLNEDQVVKDIDLVIEETLKMYDMNFNWGGMDGEYGDFNVFYNLDYFTPFYTQDCGSNWIFLLTPEKMGEDYIDIFVHEFQHGVTQSHVDLEASRGTPEAGALNEAYSDIMTAMFDQEDQWEIIGLGRVIRNMANPEKLKNPDHYDKLVSENTWKGQLTKIYDKGEVEYGFGHVNSTIISHAAYLLAVGGNKSGVKIQGIGIPKMVKIFFLGLHYMEKNADFLSARSSLIYACEVLSGEGQTTLKNCDQVKNAFSAVGIGLSAEKEFLIKETRKNVLDSIISDVISLREQLLDYLNKINLEPSLNIQDHASRIQEDFFGYFIKLLEKSIVSFTDQLIREFVHSACGSLFIAVIPVLLHIFRRFF